MSEQIWDVAVLGAGASGLAAAEIIAKAGFSVAILEARNRTGGRIATDIDSLGYPAELGAEFIHGKPPDTFELVKRASLEVTELDGDFIYLRDGKLQPASMDSALDDVLEAIVNYDGPDMPFSEFLNTLDVIPEAASMVKRYVEGFDAANPDTVSVHWLAQTEIALAEIDGERDFRVNGGYAGIIQFLERSCRESGASIYLEHIIRQIEWQQGQVVIQTLHGETIVKFKAKCCLITLPVGVLKSTAAPVFTPELEEKQMAIQHIHMGSILKLVLRFRSRIWPDTAFFITDPPGVQTWWTQSPDSVPVLTAWISGDLARRWSTLEAEQLTAQVLTSLARTLNISRDEVEKRFIEFHYHNWMSDPFAKGAYSYIAHGGMNAPALLAEPIADTLFFAGEATETDGHTGTVHGALMTGKRAAEEIISVLRSK